MCGIVGCLIFENSTNKITDDYIKELRDSLIHRGPDNGGLWISKNQNIGLGHRRLSIIDISNEANQPMGDIDKEIMISFNGEIYNHKELRNELEAKGKYKWITDHSDTEVVINSYLEWGEECVKHFRGMFSIAIWDGVLKKLFLFRDRLGIKPLYYCFLKDRIIFASEIKAILEDKLVPRIIDEEALINQLTYLFVPSPKTMFLGINKVPNATCISIEKDGEFTENKYWDASNFFNQNKYESLSNTNSELIDEIKESVEYHAMSDVPASVFLSGGIDSSLITKINSELDKDIKAFTIAYDKEYKNIESEISIAENFSKNIGIEISKKKLNRDEFIGLIPKIIYFQDEPISDPNCFATFYTSKLANENKIKVAHVGEGADELFIGYQSWIKYYKLSKYLDKFLNIKFLKSLKLIYKIFKKLFDTIRVDSWKFDYIKRHLDDKPIFWGSSNSINTYLKNKILSTRMKKKFRGYDSWQAIKDVRKSFNSKVNKKDFLKWMTYLELNTRLPDLLLMRVDKMSMAFSVECRVPFLDHKLIEYVMKIPSEKLINKKNPKYLLKKVIKGLIPNSIINRKKQGLGTPIDFWIEGRLKKIMYNEVIYFSEKTGIFDLKEVEKIFSKNQKLYAWQLFNIALWWRTFIESGKTLSNIDLLSQD